MDQISDLKQWLDSQTVKSEQTLSPHHTVEDDFAFNNESNDRPFVTPPKFKEDRYLWHEDGKNEHPEMNRLAEKEPMSDYEKAKALWYKNAWEHVQPVDTEFDSSNTFKKAHTKTAVKRVCPECNSDNLILDERAFGSRHVVVEDQEVDWMLSGDPDWYESEDLGITCLDCRWSHEGHNWIDYLGYGNQKNSKHRKTAVRRTCPNCHSPDYLQVENRIVVSESVSVDDNDLEYHDSEYGDDYEFIAAYCHNCSWSSNSRNWINELGYDNRKNS